MTTNPAHYLEMAAARHAQLIIETDWRRLLNPPRPAAARPASPLRALVAARLRRLADWLYAEPDTLSPSWTPS